MGYSGNNDPQFIIPTCIATSTSKGTRGKIDDLDYFIGDEAMVILRPLFCFILIHQIYDRQIAKLMLCLILLDMAKWKIGT